MSAPQSLIQAALNRLVVRLGSGLADAAAELALLAQDAPGRLRREWQLFVEEVELEADRLDHEEASSPTPGSEAWAVDGSAASPGASAHGTQPLADPQDQIDQLRAQVAAMARQLEESS
ncbi:MAG: hypothetical protein CK536_09590 [Synechococcus sp. Baikal-G1]|nr:MAG: hypothetical protein CK536_09590 [Synechococcus sp. Baikal-G1]